MWLQSGERPRSWLMIYVCYLDHLVPFTAPGASRSTFPTYVCCTVEVETLEREAVTKDAFTRGGVGVWLSARSCH